MALSRRIARPLLASSIIAGGVDALRHPDRWATELARVTGPIAPRLPVLPDDPRTLVRANGVVQVGAGALLAAGRLRRTASVVLIGSLLVAGLPVRAPSDAADRGERRVRLLSYLGLLGGLLLTAVDTEGEPSLAWRARRRAARVEQAVGVHH
jgi:putative oxidoreductase